MLQRMEAEILFLDPDDVGPGVAELVARDFKVEILDWVDPTARRSGSKPRLRASSTSTASSIGWQASSSHSTAMSVEAGLSDPQQAA